MTHVVSYRGKICSVELNLNDGRSATLTVPNTIHQVTQFELRIDSVQP